MAGRWRIPARRGFGSELIERLVPYEFGGTGRLEYGIDGVSCAFRLPLSEGLNVDERGPRPGGPATPATEAGAGRRKPGPGG